MLRTPFKAAAVSAAALAAILLANSPSSSQQAAEPADPRIEKFKSVVASGVEERRKLAQVINDTVFSFGELGYQEFETSKYLTDVLEKNGFTIERGFAGMPTAWVATLGLRQAGDRARLRHRLHPAGLAEARRRLSRAADRRRARPRRRPQFRAGGEHHRGARGEGADGAREAARHDHALAGRRRGTARRQGVLRARRHVQGRRRRALHARRRQPRHDLGTAARQRPRLGRVHLQGRERARRRSRPGAAAARSTRSS